MPPLPPGGGWGEGVRDGDSLGPMMRRLADAMLPHPDPPPVGQGVRHRAGPICSTPPMYGTNAFGMRTEPSACW
jgi:hypothetical protein